MQTSPRRYQQLQPEDRVTMASLLQQNHSLRVKGDYTLKPFL